MVASLVAMTVLRSASLATAVGPIARRLPPKFLECPTDACPALGVGWLAKLPKGESGGAQFAHGELEAGLDRAQRDTRCRGDLPLRKTAIVGELDGFALRGGQMLDELRDGLRGVALRDFFIGASVQPGVIGHHFVAVAIAGAAVGAFAANAIDGPATGEGHDPAEGLSLFRVVTGGVLPHAEQDLLHEIAHVGVIIHHATDDGAQEGFVAALQGGERAFAAILDLLHELFVGRLAGRKGGGRSGGGFDLLMIEGVKHGVVWVVANPRHCLARARGDLLWRAARRAGKCVALSDNSVVVRRQLFPSIHPTARYRFSGMSSDPDIPQARVAAFVRQFTHDVRNGLNGLDLEAAYLLELETDAEARASVQRMRQQIRGLAEQLRSLGGRFHEPRPHRWPLAARELIEILREQNAALATPVEIAWSEDVGDAVVEVDGMLVTEVFGELLANAAAFPASGPVRVEARREAGEVVIELIEPKNAPLDPAAWGEAPFASSRRGAYGLGLWTARRLSEAGGIKLTQAFSKAGALVTTLRIPVA